MSWKFVFNPEFSLCRNIEDCAKLTRSIRYQFFLWNGIIYFVSQDSYFETKITIKDLF